MDADRSRSARAAAPVDAGGTSTPPRLRYPGAPLPRWWQIEDAAVDIGGYPPDRRHFATLLLIDLIVNHSDDWFTLPGRRRARARRHARRGRGHDSFGDEWTLEPPTDWSLFATDGLDRALAGALGDGRHAAGRAGARRGRRRHRRGRQPGVGRRAAAARPRRADRRRSAIPSRRRVSTRAAAPGFAYRPTTRVPRTGTRTWSRRSTAAAGSSRAGPPTCPARPPCSCRRRSSDSLIDPASGGVHPVHQLEPAAIPQDGLRLERRAMLARATDGAPVLWTQRRRQPLLTPPALRLRFDTLEPVPPA